MSEPGKAGDSPRLLQILPGGTIGGVERYGLTIGLAAARAGWDVHAEFPFNAETAPLADAYRDGGVGTHSIERRTRGPGFGRVATIARDTTRMLGQIRPDVVHVNLPFPTLARGELIGCALRGVPTVATFHLAPDGVEAGRSRRIYPLLHARSQAWVTVSEHDRDVIADLYGIAREELIVIRNGVPPLVTEEPSEAERAEVRRELGLPESSLIALSVGRLSKQKGHEQLIRIAREAVTELPQVHFVIAGEGELHEDLEAQIRKQGVEKSVHLLGQRDDVDRLLRSADVFLLPSLYEGFPFALLEAAAHGLPIVSADVGGASEIVSHKQSGLLHAPGETEELRQWLRFVLQNPAEARALGERARQGVGRFSEAEMIRSTLALLETQALRRRSRRRLRGRPGARSR
jgi:glycosyltransferase involved in cell wall biosynthesis